MSTDYHSKLLDNCVTCPLATGNLFCDLPCEARQRLNEIKAIARYPKGAVLFTEKQQPRGVFVLCAGEAKLSTCSSAGRTLITSVSKSGEVLGLNAVISNRPYEVTAAMTEPGQANFITRDAVLQLQKDHRQIAVRVAEELSRTYYTAHQQICILGLATSASQKFGMLLLSWWPESLENQRSARVKLTLTQEEIAEMLGMTRVTISQMFSEFKRKQLLDLTGKTLVIRNRRALLKIVPGSTSEVT